MNFYWTTYIHHPCSGVQGRNVAKQNAGGEVVPSEDGNEVKEE